MAVTITEWNKETNSLVTQDYPPPPVRYIDITADNWMQYWGQEVEVQDTSIWHSRKLAGWCPLYNRVLCTNESLGVWSTWKRARIKASTEPYYYLKDEDVIRRGDSYLDDQNQWWPCQDSVGFTVIEAKRRWPTILFKVRRKR